MTKTTTPPPAAASAPPVAPVAPAAPPVDPDWVVYQNLRKGTARDVNGKFVGPDDPITGTPEPATERAAAAEAVWNAARDAVWGAVSAAVWSAVSDAVWNAARAAVWGAARDAVWSAVTWDLATPDGPYTIAHRDLLIGPWLTIQPDLVDLAVES